MKRQFVFVLKAGVSLLPKTLREALKKNLRLSAFYTRTLRNTGFIQALPSEKKQAASYLKNVHGQSAQIEQFSVPEKLDGVLVIYVVDANLKKMQSTVDSINKLAAIPESVLFYTSTALATYCNKLLKKIWSGYTADSVVTHLTSSVLAETADRPCFVVMEGDAIHPDFAKVLNALLLEDTQVAYVDTDHLDDDGERHSPEFYPDWNPDLQLSTAYIQSGVWFTHFKKFIQAQPMEPNWSSVAEWFIHAYLHDSLLTVQHIPMVLVHRPEVSPGIYRNLSVKTRDLLSQKGEFYLNKKQEVLALKWNVKDQPLVSLIIPTRNGKDLVKACVESILEKTTYANYEILLVDNNSDEQESISYFETLALHPKISVLQYPYEFNYSAINNFAAKQAKGEVIGLVNNDIEIIKPDWLSHMLGHVLRPDIGCVGAKLLYANDLIQHAGVVMGYGGGAGHAHKYFPADHPGYLHRLTATHNYSAVTAACLLVKKSDFDSVQGLNEVELKVAFNDVDFCLRILGLGRRNLYCAEAVLYHHESVSRGEEDTVEKLERFNAEVAYMQSKWQHFIDHDPAYNPNLTLRHENFAIKE
jgi:GT2 family glycosyltransferase